MDTAKAIAMIKKGLAMLEAEESGEGELDEPMQDGDMQELSSPAAKRFGSGMSARKHRSEGVKRARAINVEE